MKTSSVARALVYAVTYINVRHADDDDSDVGALESIAGMLADASESEKDILATAAREAYRDELKLASPRHEFLDDYGSWMEDMFGEGWSGNDRVTD